MSEDHVLYEGPDSEHESWQDRLTDAALREAIGGETPPDLSAAITARATEPIASVATGINERRTTPLRVAIAASLVIGCGALAYWGQPRAERQVALREDTGRSTKAEVAKEDDDSNRDAELLLPSVERETGQIRDAGSKPADQSRFDLGVGVNGDAGVVRGIERDKQNFERPSRDPVQLGDGASSSLLVRPEVRFDSARTAASASAGQQGSETFNLDMILTFDGPIDSKGPASGASLAEARLPRVKQEPLYKQSLAGSQPLGLSFPQQHHARPSVRAFAFRGAGQRIWPENSKSQDIDGWLPESLEGRGPGQGGDQYARIYDNPFVEARGEQALSTFSIDVDTASYANVRRFLTAGQLPPADAVRIEELVNYFDYRYAGPPADNPAPFAANLEVTGCPWTPTHRLVRIGVKGREVKLDKRPLSNLVFLVDVSGSMNSPDKLPLVVEGLKKLTEQLGENDRVAIVVYASSEGLALPSTQGDKRDEIRSALGRLTAGGSTAGGAGITLAYQVAEDHFIDGGTNRVILCTDGDFNVGTTSTGELERLVAEKAKQTGVFLSVCGFGRGNLNDAMMETVSNRGNGNYFYVDGEQEAEKVFVKGLTGTLVTIAKDVKIQVEFNPAKVAGYRLLGYENRLLAAQDFNDDKKDAGEIGAGHTVTALYEIVPVGVELPAAKVDELKYQKTSGDNAKPSREATAGQTTAGQTTDELLTLKMRYKQPDGDVSTKLEWTATDDGKKFADASSDTRFAAAAAGFGMLLRGSEHAGGATFAQIEEMALAALYDEQSDPNGYRQEFVELVRKARSLTKQE